MSLKRKINLVKYLDQKNDRLKIGFISRAAGLSPDMIHSRRKLKKDFTDEQRVKVIDALYLDYWLMLGEDFGFLDRFRAQVVADTEKKVTLKLAREQAAELAKIARSERKNNQEQV